MLVLIAVIAIVLGGLSYRIRSQQASLHRLRQLGGQMEVPEMNLLTWLAGISIESVQFLGPAAGDESVGELGDASVSLSIKRITFFETRVTENGVRNLRHRLPSTEIQLVTPSLDRVPAIRLR